MSTAQYQLVRHEGSRPPAAVQLAQEYDGNRQMWTAVAHTEHGDIPGKAAGGTCWYSYGGMQYETQNFSWLVAPNYKIVLQMNYGSGPPPTALKIGYQNDGAGDIFAAVAISDEWGSIPGKAKGHTCWYPYDGKEHTTSTFFWVTTLFSLAEGASGPPRTAVQLAWQYDRTDGLYSAVAHTQWGDIPGKASHDTCWFGYDGGEYTADSFSYVVAPMFGAALEENSSGPPNSALKTGHQSDGSGYLYAAVAKTDYGNIPAKAAGSQCWYTYHGKEHTTTNFYWVVALYDSEDLEIPLEEIIMRTKRQVGGETICSVYRDSHTSDEFVEIEGGRINDPNVLHVREASQILIARWENNSTMNSISGSTIDQIAANRRTQVRLDNQGDFNENGVRYANMQIQTGGVTVAAVQIQNGVNFGARLIRRALNLSLQRGTMVRLRRRNIPQPSYYPRHDEL